MSNVTAIATRRRAPSTVNIADRFNDPGFHRIAPKLYLRVEEAAGGDLLKIWFFRARLHGKPRKWSLGSAADVTAQEAMNKAKGYGIEVADGREPGRAITHGGKTWTFAEGVEMFDVAKLQPNKNKKAAKTMKRQLEKCYPVMGNLTVAQVEPAHVAKAIKDEWTRVPPTSKRTRRNIELIFEHAIAMGARTAANPATIALLKHALPKHKKRRTVHHRAMTWRDVPKFYRELTLEEVTSARALRFLILTVARTNEVIGGRWSEIGGNSHVWEVPDVRMKMGIAHDVPLSTHALALLASWRETRRGVFIFPGGVTGPEGSHIQNNAMLDLIRRLGYGGDFTPHGFRSSFTEWQRETRPADRELRELSLAHKFGDDTESAYARETLLDQRRVLMQAWGDFVCK